MSFLKVNGLEVPLKQGASIQFDLNNLLFGIFGTTDPPGMFSYGFNVPATPEARLAFGFPELMENAADITREFPGVEYSEDNFSVVGTLKYLGMAGPEYRFNLETGLSRVVKLLKETKLGSLNYHGTRFMGLEANAIEAHMRVTVENPFAYNYVFAPIYNPTFYGDENDDYLEAYGQYVNHWDNSIVEDGVDWGGYFLVNSKFHPYGPNGSTRHSISPQPFLKYTLLQALKELGIVFEDHFFDQELATVVIHSSTALDNIQPEPLGADQVIFEKNLWKASFRYADLLPDTSVWDLIRAAMTTFGLFPDFTLDGRLRLLKVKDVVESPEFVELPLAESVFESEMPENAGITLTYSVGEGDSVAEENIKDFSDVTLLGPVESTVALEGNVNDVRYVQPLDQYFILKRFKKKKYLASVNTWELYSENFLPQKLNGGGPDYQLGSCATVMQSRHRYIFKIKDPVTHFDALNILVDEAGEEGKEGLVEENDVRLVQDENKYYIYAKTFASDAYEKSLGWQFFSENSTLDQQNTTFRKWLVPAIGTPAYSPEYDQREKPTGIRFLFYRGLQPFSETKATYPMLSSDNHNALGFKVGEYSLRWHGPDGLHEKFWKRYFDIILHGKPARRKIFLDSTQLQNLSLTRKIQIDGIQYFITRIRFTSPVSKAATLDLISCR